ncbi:hypothetical protein VSR68_34020 [Paraburkholderia phymatum]|uniref:hypothetical protein n=1 Tax=Paraburkholderia phymatum TaxID=148447 RepID=UPI003179E8ED
MRVADAHCDWTPTLACYAQNPPLPYFLAVAIFVPERPVGRAIIVMAIASRHEEQSGRNHSTNRAKV